ncbi:MAG: SDR family NAD(P)-dependent oxidoreductase [Rikenellaceae bacterium]|nr:SDR family NAD(P)-dependent oxidoreductase [Rikenellaceae bacterium]
MGKTALITGATSGIGEATAVRLARRGFDLIVTGRRCARLRELKKKLEAAHGIEVLPLSFDVRDRHQCEAAIDSLPEAFRRIDVLVNNAGLAAGLEHIDEGDPNDWDRMIDTNIKGLLYITRKVAQGMVAQGAGHIVNIGSIAGSEVYENGAAYCASKHAVHALSQGMRIDLLRHGIRVTEIRPGMVETEFSIVRFDGDADRAANVYKGVKPLTANDVARTVCWAISQPAHVNVSEIVLMPTQQADAFYTHRK